MKLSELFMRHHVPGLGWIACPDEVEAPQSVSETPDWTPCPECGGPMTDDSGASWPYCPMCPWPPDDEEYPW